MAISDPLPQDVIYCDGDSRTMLFVDTLPGHIPCIGLRRDVSRDAGLEGAHIQQVISIKPNDESPLIARLARAILGDDVVILPASYLNEICREAGIA